MFAFVIKIEQLSLSYVSGMGGFRHVQMGGLGVPMVCRYGWIGYSNGKVV